MSVSAVPVAAGQEGSAAVQRNRPTSCLTILAAVLAGAAIVPAVRADDWPQWLGPNRSGISAETGWRAAFPPAGPKRLWKADIGIGYSSTAVSQGYLYTLGNRDGTDTLYRFNARTGALSWKYPYKCSSRYPGGLLNAYPGPRSTPTLADGRVYWLSRAGQLFCLDAKRGTVVWSLDVKDKPLAAKVPTWGFACSPLALGKWLVVDVGPIAALDSRTGKLVWQSRRYRPGYASPVPLSLAGRACLATFNADGLTVVDANDGGHVLLHPFKVFFHENCATPIVSGDQCFVSAGHRPGCALIRLAGPEGVEIWRNRNMMNHANNAVLWKGHLYGFHGSLHGSNSLRCVAWATGKTKWTHGKLGRGAVALADGKLLALSGRGVLAIGEASPEGFRPLAQAKVLSGTCWTQPVLANGRLYCRSREGELVCLDLRGEPPAGG
jgi:outer membrane protein assembly factor BamB